MSAYALHVELSEASLKGGIKSPHFTGGHGGSEMESDFPKATQ